MCQSLLRILFLLILFFSTKAISQDHFNADIDSLEEIVQNKGVDKIIKIEAYLELSKIYWKKDLDSAMYYAQIGLELSLKNAYTKGQAVAHIRKCKILDLGQDMEKAIEQGVTAIELYDNLVKDEEYLFIHNLLGYLYERQTNFDVALELYLEGLNSAKKQGDEEYQAFFYNNAATIYKNTDHLDRGIEFYLKAIAIYKKLGLNKFYGGGLSNIATIYMEKKEYELARKYLKDAEAISLGLKNYYSLEKVELNLGLIAEEQGDLKQALDHFLKGLQYAEKLDTLNEFRARSVAYMHEKLGGIYLKRRNYQKAIGSYQIALTYGEKNKSNDLLSHSYYDLFSIYTELNQIDSANYYLHLYLPVNDSLVAEKYNKQIDALNYEYNINLEKEKHNQEKLLIINDQREEKFKLLLTISLLVLLTGTILFFLYSQKNKLIRSELKSRNLQLEKKNLNLDLERRSKELSTTLLNLIERNQFIVEISENLENIDSIQNLKDRSKIQSILKDIDRNTSKKLWKEFELSYVGVHSEFFERLNSHCPNLTSNDRRLCALIKLNMSTKDISSITYQSTQTIKVARYRLRKKLGVEKNENLTTFLNAI